MKIYIVYQARVCNLRLWVLFVCTKEFGQVQRTWTLETDRRVQILIPPFSKWMCGNS